MNPFGIGPEDAEQALRNANALWAMVETNDLDAFRQFVVEPLRSQFADVDDLLGAFHVTAEEARVMAASTKVRVLDDGGLLVITMKTGGEPRVLGVEGTELVPDAWGLRQIKVAGEWRVVGINDEAPRERIDWIDVAPDEGPPA